MIRFRDAPVVLLLAGCAGGSNAPPRPAAAVSLGPADQGVTFPRQDGDEGLGREVFRFETFGNERFWTDAVRLPAGVTAAKVTPLQALKLGLQVDVEGLDRATREALLVQVRADPSGRTSALLNDPEMTARLFSANAVIGMPAKDSNGDGVVDVTRGDKVGASCALCHTMTDGSAFSIPGAGSIGRRKDGLANLDLDLGAIFATALNSRALYPILQLSLKANGGKTLGRAPQGLTDTSSEAMVDAYLRNRTFYPVGMFDDSFDGNGDPMQNSPLFRQDLAAPYGSEGMIARLDNFSNLVYTSLFDLTILTTPGGRALLHKLGGAAGDEIADGYVRVLAATGVSGYPFVTATPHPHPGSEDAPVGLRVDNTKLLALNGYLAHLEAPPGAPGEAAVVARGRELFSTSGCTACHNVDQSRRVPSGLIAMGRIFPGDAPVVLAQRKPPLNPVLNTPSSFFDDKMAVVNASLRGDIRGVALPLLLDLARKPVFLHDKSAVGLEVLLDPARGPAVPHPFYLHDAAQRAAVAAYLRNATTNSKQH